MLCLIREEIGSGCVKLRPWRGIATLVCAAMVIGGCGGGSSGSVTPQPTGLVVNSLEDPDQAPAGVVTLRAALAQAASGETIRFASSLNGGTIALTIIGQSHTTLKGEVYSGMTFQGYQDRDYGKSALYAQKNVVLDASSLPAGITIAWTGGDTNPARVLAVYGNLKLSNVKITGGYSLAEATGVDAQPYTLARGGGLAVWGTATLKDCTVSGNKILGDLNASRDRGAYGGGIYANGLQISNCVVSGNAARGYGAAGGGIYSVGGADNTTGIGNDTSLSACTISGNRLTAQHAYGGGVFTLSGGPNNLAQMTISNCTVARNLIEHNPDLQPVGPHYYRGAGIYMGGGSLTLASSTVVENVLTGYAAVLGGAPNMGGGGIAATIGNAHVVEDMRIRQSIVAGNTMNGKPEDVFSGSLIGFYSLGYNRFGVVDFSQILVPVPDWMDMSRKHYPKIGDLDGVALTDVVSVNAAQVNESITSVGSDMGQPAVLWYPPVGNAVDQIPTGTYSVTAVTVGYDGYGKTTDDFLNQLLLHMRAQDSKQLGSDFDADCGDMTGVTWSGEMRVWPTDPNDAAWISFWRTLDTDIGNKLGTVILGDEFWSTFPTGAVGNEVVHVTSQSQTTQMVGADQRGHTRPSGAKGDIGAIEK